MSYLPLKITPRIYVSSADLLSIVSSPKTLLPAQWANTIVNVQQFIMEFASGTAYTYASNLFLTMGANTLFNLGNPITGSSVIKSAGGQSATLTANTAVTLSWGGSDPTSGTGTMRIKLFYTIEQLTIMTFTSSFNTTINTSSSYDLNTVITKNSPWVWPFTYSINTAPSGTSISTNTLTTWGTWGSLIVNIIDAEGRTSTATTTISGGSTPLTIRITDLDGVLNSGSWLTVWNVSMTSLTGSVSGNLLGSFTVNPSFVSGNTWVLWTLATLPLAQNFGWNGTLNFWIWGLGWLTISGDWTQPYNGTDTTFTINVRYQEL